MLKGSPGGYFVKRLNRRNLNDDGAHALSSGCFRRGLSADTTGVPAASCDTLRLDTASGNTAGADTASSDSARAHTIRRAVFAIV